MTTRQPWTRQEADLLERYLLDGLKYRHIAERLGRSVASVRGKADRTGLSDKARQAHKAIPKAREERLLEIIGDCIEFRRMTCLDTTRYLNTIGETISNAWVHKRIQGRHRLRKLAAENARRRRSTNMRIQRQMGRLA